MSVVNPHTRYKKKTEQNNNRVHGVNGKKIACSHNTKLIHFMSLFNVDGNSRNHHALSMKYVRLLRIGSFSFMFGYFFVRFVVVGGELLHRTNRTTKATICTNTRTHMHIFYMCIFLCSNVVVRRFACVHYEVVNGNYSEYECNCSIHSTNQVKK